MNNNLSKANLKICDFSVSREIFDLHYDGKLDMFSTFPIPANLSKYYESQDYISHTDGKRSLLEKVYHWVKKIAIRNKINLINSESASKGLLLDIGAGTGDFLVEVTRNGWKTVGIEPSEKAKTIAQSKGVTFIGETSDLEDHSVDVVTMWHVLEHVENLEEQIAELKRIIRPDGVVVVAVPNFKSYDAVYYKEFWAGYDVPRHVWHFSKTAISSLFARQQFVLDNVLPMKFDAYYVSLLSEKYKRGSMNLFNAFAIGFKSNWQAKRSKEYSSHIYILRNAK